MATGRVIGNDVGASLVTQMACPHVAFRLTLTVTPFLYLGDMQSFWYCLDCNAPLPERDESCRLCKQTWEQQHSSGPNYYELWTDADFAALDREIDYLESKEREHHEVRMQNYAKKKEAEAWWRANG